MTKKHEATIANRDAEHEYTDDEIFIGLAEHIKESLEKETWFPNAAQSQKPTTARCGPFAIEFTAPHQWSESDLDFCLRHRRSRLSMRFAEEDWFLMIYWVGDVPEGHIVHEGLWKHGLSMLLKTMIEKPDGGGVWEQT